MKLLNYTSKYLLILLLPLIAIWAVIFYYAMLGEIYDSLDDGLENRKVLILQHTESTLNVLAGQDFKTGNYAVEKISEREFSRFKESFRDTLIYMQNEQDFEPVRIYESAYTEDGKFFKMKIITSMVEQDDLIRNLAIYLVALYMFMSVSIVLLNNIILRRIWKPFYSLISQLKNFNIAREKSIIIKGSAIDEFQLLNETVKHLTEKSQQTFLNQKHFIENASHELQTPLAISINKLELYSEKNGLSEDQLTDIAFVLDNLGRLTRLNKSLLLISKIENQQFIQEENIDFKSITDIIALDFEDFLLHREIELKIVSNSSLSFEMNRDLALILVTNLVKNAIVHGEERSHITIEISHKKFIVNNRGLNGELDSERLFSRFNKTNIDSRSTGLGLAIAKAITQKYGIILTYSYTESHNFILDFP